MIDFIPPAEMGRFLGFSNIATAGSGIIARLIAGPLLDHFNAGTPILGTEGGYPVVFAMFVGYFVVGLFLVLPVVEPRRPPATPAGP
jgi:hypothetical protein